MVVTVGEDYVAGPDQGRQRAGIGGEPGGKHQGRLRGLELRQASLEFLVDLRVAEDKWTSSAPPTILVNSGGNGRFHARVRRQPEVVVGPKMDKLTAVHPNYGGERSLANREAAADSLLLEGIELLRDPRQ